MPASNQTPPQKSANKKGFTLIELLVVITIIGILASVGMISYYDAQKRGRDAKRIRDLDEIKKALQLYYNDNGKFPSTIDYWEYSNTGNAWLTGLSPTYMASIPVDPINKDASGGTAACPAHGAGCYQYNYYSGNWCNQAGNGQYMLSAHLESTTKSSSYYVNILDDNGNLCSPWPTTDPTVYPSLYIIRP